MKGIAKIWKTATAIAKSDKARFKCSDKAVNKPTVWAKSPVYEGKNESVQHL